jgi:hypothetical protein
MSTKTRGFASLSAKRRHELAVMGGKANTNRHQWTPKEAREAGRRSGRVRRKQ